MSPKMPTRFMKIHPVLIEFLATFRLDASLKSHLNRYVLRKNHWVLHFSIQCIF